MGADLQLHWWTWVQLSFWEREVQPGEAHQLALLAAVLLGAVGLRGRDWHLPLRFHTRLQGAAKQAMNMQTHASPPRDIPGQRRTPTQCR